MAIRAALLSLLLLASCGRVAVEREYACLQQETEMRTGHTPYWERTCADVECITQNTHARLLTPITQDDAVAIALSNNPTLQARYEMLGIAKSDVVQAGLLTNPSLSIDWRLPSGRSDVESSLLFNLADLWQIPLKKQVARTQQRATHAYLLADILKTAGDAKRAFTQRTYTQAKLSLAQELLSRAQKIESRIVYRQNYGFTSDLDIALTSAQVGMQGTMLLESDRMNMMANLDLRKALGLGDQAPPVRLAPPKPPPPLPSKQTLVRRALELNPQILALQCEVASARAQYRLEKASVWSSVGVGLAEAKSPGAPNGFGPGIGFQLPLFDQNRAQIAKATYRLRQLEKELEAMRLEIATHVRQLHQAYTTAQAQLALYTDTILPSLEKASSYTERFAHTYQLNTVIELQTFQQLTEASSAQLDLLLTAQDALIALEEHTGHRLG